MTLCLATLYQSRQLAPNVTVCSGISHHRSFKTCPHFPRTAHRHRSSIQIRAAYSITARSASLRMPLTRCSVDLLHLDQFSWTLSNVGGTPRPFHASNYLGLTQVLNWDRRIVDSATLSTTGCCRSRSFSSSNHRNSCNKISTCCLNRYSSLQRESFHLSW